MLLDKFSTFGDHLQKSNIEAIEKVKEQFKEKLEKYKIKIEEGQEREMQLETERDKEI